MSEQRLDKLMKLYEQECKIEQEAGQRKTSIWNQIQNILAEDEYIRPSEAGKILGVTGQAIINWIRAGVFNPGEYRQISTHTYVISKKVVKMADFYERRNSLGRTDRDICNNNTTDIEARLGQQRSNKRRLLSMD